MLEIIIGMSIVVLSGNNLEIELGLEPPFKSSPCCPRSQEGQYTYSNKLTNHEAIIFYLFLDKFCILRQLCHDCAPSTQIPTNTCPTKHSNSRGLGYTCVLSVVQIFRSIGNHLHIWTHKKNVLKIRCS